MPFSIFFPIGILIALVGAALFFRTRARKPGLVMVGAGLLIAAFTIIVIVLAVNSM